MKTRVPESRTGNPLSPEPFVSHAKAPMATRGKKCYGDENASLPRIIFSSLSPSLSQVGIQDGAKLIKMRLLAAICIAGQLCGFELLKSFVIGGKLKSEKLL